jgi:ubiquinone/menaquinone biosynthesis C-methylase UbiE
MGELMQGSKNYIIRGGIKGRERLRIISRVLHSTTTSLLDRLKLDRGDICLDAGCGGGDVTREIARRVGPEGKVIGIDIDSEKIEIARTESAQLGITNIEFRLLDICKHQLVSNDDYGFDAVYARFLLTHLPDPASVINAFYAALKPGGVVILEDIEISGSFVFPESKAFRRFYELYIAAVRKRGGDPDIGPRLPLLLKDGGFEKVDLNIVQPTGLEGEMKFVNPITMENIGDAVVQMELASREEVDGLIQEMYDFASSPLTIAGTARIVQAWGWRPTAP